MRVNRDAVMISRPRLYFEMHKEMVEEINRQLGIKTTDQLTMAAFEGPCLPSATEISVAHRLNIAIYTLAELAVTEALRNLQVNSFILSQNFQENKLPDKAAEHTKELLKIVFSPDLAKKLETIDEKNYTQKLAMELDYTHALDYAAALRKKFCENAPAGKFLKQSIVLRLELTHRRAWSRTRRNTRPLPPTSRSS